MFSSHWLVVLAAAVILFIVFLIGYNVTDEVNMPFWVWLVFFLSLILGLMAFSMHAAEKVARGPVPNAPGAGNWYRRDLEYNIQDAAQPYPFYVGGKTDCVVPPPPACPPSVPVCRPCGDW